MVTHSVKVVKRFRWSMAHRLTHGYTGRCASLHGHEYEVGVTISGSMDEMGLVVDFGDVKKVCGGWIKEYLDHTTIVCQEDTSLLAFLQEEDQRHYSVPFNTTAENIAVHLRATLQSALDEGIDNPLQVESITLMETPNSCVETP